MALVNEPMSASSGIVDCTGRGAGRPRAKHSSPDYAQMTVYVLKTLRNSVKMRLFQEGLEMSALVERLLQNWLDAKVAEKDCQ